MTVSTIASIAAGITRTSGNPATQAASLFKTLLGGDNAQQPVDSTNFTAAITQQQQVAQLRIASKNLAGASTTLSTADSGIAAIQSDLEQLDGLAKKAATTSDNAERAALNTQFKAVAKRIDERANSTKFNNESLLNGSSPQLKLSGDNKNIKDLTIGSLTSNALFKGGLPEIATIANAKTAIDQIKEARAYAAKQRDNIKALEKGLDLASSTLQTAIQNHEAAHSTLGEGDLIATLLGGGSQTAQTNNLPGNILGLLKE